VVVVELNLGGFGREQQLDVDRVGIHPHSARD
jgi:hypothetical protein